MKTTMSTIVWPETSGDDDCCCCCCCHLSTWSNWPATIATAAVTTMMMIGGGEVGNHSECYCCGCPIMIGYYGGHCPVAWRNQNWNCGYYHGRLSHWVVVVVVCPQHSVHPPTAVIYGCCRCRLSWRMLKMNWMVTKSHWIGGMSLNRTDRLWSTDCGCCCDWQAKGSQSREVWPPQRWP